MLLHFLRLAGSELAPAVDEQAEAEADVEAEAEEILFPVRLIEAFIVLTSGVVNTF